MAVISENFKGALVVSNEMGFAGARFAGETRSRVFRGKPVRVWVRPAAEFFCSSEAADNSTFTAQGWPSAPAKKPGPPRRLAPKNVFRFFRPLAMGGRAQAQPFPLPPLRDWEERVPSRAGPRCSRILPDGSPGPGVLFFRSLGTFPKGRAVGFFFFEWAMNSRAARLGPPLTAPGAGLMTCGFFRGWESAHRTNLRKTERR